MKCEKAGCANIPQHRPNDAHHERAIMIYDTILFKPFLCPKERCYCSDCGKALRIDDDDLAELYSSSDYCQCDSWQWSESGRW